MIKICFKWRKIRNIVEDIDVPKSVYKKWTYLVES